MLAEARAQVEPLVAAGKTVDEAVAARPLAGLDARWGKGVFKGSHFTRLVYSGLAMHREKSQVPILIGTASAAYSPRISPDLGRRPGPRAASGAEEGHAADDGTAGRRAGANS